MEMKKQGIIEEKRVQTIFDHVRTNTKFKNYANLLTYENIVTGQDRSRMEQVD